MNKNKQRLFEVISTIDKSFKKPLNEEYKDWYFSTKNVEADIWHIEKFYPNYEVDIISPKFEVKWHIYPEIRDFGVKSMDILVDGVSGYFYVTLYDKNTGDVVEEGIEIDINKWKWEIEITDNTQKFENGAYPTSLEFDFNDMICTVTFN